MTHRAAGDDHLRRGAEEPRYREPPLIGISAPWRWQAEQNPAPPQETAEPGAAFKQLAEALCPYGFRWPHERQASQPAGQLTAESLFLQAGQSQIAYLNWKTGTQPNLRLVRLFLLMQRGWSTAAIEEAISEPALASWWLSGEPRPGGWIREPIRPAKPSCRFCTPSPSRSRALGSSGCGRSSAGHRPRNQTRRRPSQRC